MMASSASNSGSSPDVTARLLAALSFLPGLGPLFAFLAIRRSASAKRRTGLLVATTLGSSITLIPALSFCVVRLTGLDRSIDSRKSREALVELGQVIEEYNDRHGRYPETLDHVLGVASRSVLALDPVRPSSGPALQYFFYRTEKDGGYHLFSKGRDGTPYTPDDLHPITTTKLPGYRHPEQR